MDLNYFKDILFDLISESDQLGAIEIVADDKANTFTVTVADDSRFVVFCQTVE